MATGDYPVSTDSNFAVPLAASQAATSISGGGGGARRDRLAGVLIIPASTNPGAVTVTDGSGSPITIFAGGAGSVLTLHPFYVPIGANSVSGPWKISTGASVSVLAVGMFT